MCWQFANLIFCRFDKLIMCLLEKNPDVICLQEVVEKFAHAVRSSALLMSLYDCSENDVGGYGVLMLVRRSYVPLFKEVALDSNMGRSLLVAELWPTEESLAYLKGGAIGTVHLESLNSPGRRRSQLEVCNQVLVRYANAILCGDFNFDDTQSWGDWRGGAASSELENRVLAEVMPSFGDQWAVLRPSERGATFDGSTNSACVRDSQEVMRYDRIMLKQGSWAGNAIQMIGTEGFEDNLYKPSDHYGLMIDCVV